MRKYSHPFFIRLPKFLLTIFGFFYPAYFLLDSVINNNLEDIGILLAAMLIVTPLFLLSAFYYQDIWVDEEGLLVEFLWKKIRVRWADIVEIKYVRIFNYLPDKYRPVITLVNGLTPFHRLFGIFYGATTKPGFIIDFSINDFQDIKQMMLSHIETNAKRDFS